MRNLKKILALVLALVMSMSMLATANAFTDDESIDETFAPAVDVLSGLKVFQGRPDGSFDPKAGITRAEVAAIIYRIVSKDVEDKQVSIYADYNKFDDVNSASWYAGYVNFCANGEYIKGYDAKHFGPNDSVTGYQALAMILRALGYDKNGEFTGAGWEVRTATIAKQRGITDNITTGTLGTAATREVVAEILFQAILVDTVNYTPAAGYELADSSLGYDNFGLEKIEGVVTANEYADLYGAYPTGADKTVLTVGEKDYTLAIGTELTDIGEARVAYIAGKGGVKTPLTIADNGTAKWETGAATDIGSDKDFLKATGLRRGAATEEFINFDSNLASGWETEIRISYWIDTDNDQAIESADDKIVYIRRGSLTNEQFEDLESIFDDDNKFDGWVVVGTKDLVEANDISNDMTWREFKKDYLTQVDVVAEDLNKNENGNWLKVIDNNGDGVADYVLKTEFVMAHLTDISSKGVYTMSNGSYGVEFDTEDKYDPIPVVSSDELAEGDVVVYAVIDNVVYAEVAEMVTESIDKKGIDYKAKTITCGENVYGQSAIEPTTAADQDAFDDSFAYDFFKFDVTDAQTELAYDLYLDFFGYVRAYTENKYTFGLGLLTDAYHDTDKKVQTAKVDLVAGAEDEVTLDVDTSNKGWLNFVDTTDDGENSNHATWDRLDEFVGEISGKFWTNVAAYAISEEDETVTLNEVDYYTNKNIIVKKSELALNADSALGTKKLTAVDANGDNDTVFATNDTVYYYVTMNAKGDLVVKSWTGYKNAPKGLSLDADDDNAYAVYTKSKLSDDYYYADVVVIEATSALSDAYFVYYANTKGSWDPEDNNAASYWLKTIDFDAEAEDGEGAWDAEAVINTEKGKIYAHFLPWFYEIKDTSEIVNVITENFAAHNIYAAVAEVSSDIHGRDYVYLNDDVSFNMNGTPVYAVSYNTAQDNGWLSYSVSECGVSDDDEIIYVTNGRDVLYAINVTESYYKDSAKEKVFFMDGLYERIVSDQNLEPLPTDYEAAVAAAKAALETKVEADLNTAEGMLNDLDKTKLSDEQKAYVADLLAAIEVELEKIADAKDLETDKATAVQAMKDFIIDAVKAADTAPAVIDDYDAVIEDAETEIVVPTWPTTDNYKTLAAVVAQWTDELNGAADATALAATLAAQKGTFTTNGAAAVYVAAVKANEFVDFCKDEATKRAADRLADVVKYFEGATIVWNNASVEAHVLGAANSTTAIPLRDGVTDINEFTVEVDAPADFAIEVGTKHATVIVTITNEYAGVKGEAATATFDVLFLREAK